MSNHVFVLVIEDWSGGRSDESHFVAVFATAEAAKKAAEAFCRYVGFDDPEEEAMLCEEDRVGGRLSFDTPWNEDGAGSGDWWRAHSDGNVRITRQEVRK